MKINNYDRWLVAALVLGVLLAWLPAGVGATEVFTREALISSLAGGEAVLQINQWHLKEQRTTASGRP